VPGSIATALSLLKSSLAELNTADQLEFTLPCGLPCVVVTRPYGKSFGAALMLPVGSRHDPAYFQGLAHLSEHMAFRGDNGALAERLSNDGGYANAWTSPSYTHFQVAGHDEQFAEAISLLANVVRGGPRQLAEFHAEREILYHEMSGYNVRGRRDEAYYGFWRSILGDPNWRTTYEKQRKSIRRLPVDVIRQFIEWNYCPQYARLAVVAPRPVADLRRALVEIFSNFDVSDGTTDVSVTLPDAEIRNTSFVFIGFRHMWVRLALRSKRSDPLMQLAAALVNHQFAGGPHSVLFRRLRTERALAYSVTSEAWPDLDRTIVDTFIGISRRSLWSALDILLEEVRKLAASGVSDDEFETYRRRSIRRHELAMDYPTKLADYLAYEMLRPTTEHGLSPQSYVEFLSQAPRVEVNRAIAELLQPANRYLFISGPVGPLARFRIRRKLLR
jgi:predicted Zn-dependent peptidase